MPSGAKKRKAAKRKNQKTAVDIPEDNQQQGLPLSPNPISDFLSPMVESRGNGHERRRPAIDDEFEETFETPRFQPETPYYSMENLNVRNSRSEVNVLLGESSKSLDVEIPLKEEESFEMKEEESGVIADNSDDSHEQIPSEEGEEGQKDDEGLKETKLDEKEEEPPVKETEVMWENLEERTPTEDVRLIENSVPVDEEKTPTENVRLIEKSVPVDEERTEIEKSVPVDEERTPTEIEKSVPVDEERTPTEIEKSVPVDEKRTLTENVRWIEKSVAVNEERTPTEDVRLIEKSVPVDEERTPNVSIEKVDVSSSNEKEVKAVPWPDLEIRAGNGVVNVDVGVICSEKDCDGDGNRNLERELNLGDENKQPVTLDENSKDVVESVQGMLPQIDVELTNNKFDVSVEKISVSAENSALITEEARHGTKTPPVNSESLVGVCDASPRGRMKTSAEPPLDAEKTGIEQRNKVACGPGRARHANVWNCCGLLDVFTSSDR